MHPLVRDLYKRVLIVGRDYPHPGGLDFVKQRWKAAIHDGERNWPLNYHKAGKAEGIEDALEEEILQAVARGRHMIKEMIGVIQLKKYREMNKRYGDLQEKEQK